MLLDAIYWIAAALALAGAVYGMRRARSLSGLLQAADPVAWALLASAGFCLCARWADLPFIPWLWASVDLVVFAAIAWPLLRDWAPALYQKELAILVLFPLMWAAYALPEAPAYVFTSIAATAQLLLTLPLRSLWGRVKGVRHLPDRWNEFDLRVRA
jgi:hypothetical protein